jgi:acetyl esterase/lipase
MRLIRSGKLAAGIDAGRVGVLGFSAGGNLAANLAFRWGVATYPAVDATDALAARPDFAALIYAAYLDGKLPEGIPSPPSSADFIAMAAKGALPMFLVHAADDQSVPVVNTLKMAAALKAAGAPVEAHVFETGGHGFGIANAGDKPARVWPDLFLGWGRARGIFAQQR